MEDAPTIRAAVHPAARRKGPRTTTKRPSRTPRPYLSWSQLSLWERAPDLYLRHYLLGEALPVTPAMAFGHRMAAILETDERTDDAVIERVKTLVPLYPRREYKLWARCPIGGEIVRLFGILDGYDPPACRIGEVKTGRQWTQQMAEENGQLTFYAFMYWQKYGRLPCELALIWIETAERDGHIAPTGHVAVYYTKRTPQDLEQFSFGWDQVATMSKPAANIFSANRE